MLPYENPTLVGDWLHTKLEKKFLHTQDFQDIARTVSDQFLNSLESKYGLDEVDREAGRARFAALLEKQSKSGELDVDWLVPALVEELAGSGYAQVNEDSIEGHIFADTAIRYADSPHFVCYWLHTFSQDEWEHEHEAIGAAVSDMFLDRFNAKYGGLGHKPEENRAVFTKWLAEHQPEMGLPWDDHIDLESLLGKELAGTTYAHEHAADIENSIPGPQTLSGYAVAYLRGMSLGDDKDATQLSREMNWFLWEWAW